MITAARTMIASQTGRFEGIWFPGIRLEPFRSQGKGRGDAPGADPDEAFTVLASAKRSMTSECQPT